MWMFTKYGFFSATCARDGTGKTATVNKNKIQVRARDKAHLENLIKGFPKELAGTPVHSFKGTDYPFRIYLPKKTWAKIAELLSEEIDYTNFKNEAGAKCGEKSPYVHALHEVWWVMLGVEKDHHTRRLLRRSHAR